MGRTRSRKKVSTKQANQSNIKLVSTDTNGDSKGDKQNRSPGKQGKKPSSPARTQRRALYKKRQRKIKKEALAEKSSLNTLSSFETPPDPWAPPSLLSLPNELLKQTLLLADLPSALAVSVVSRRLNKIADHRVWRNLEVSVSIPRGESNDAAEMYAKFGAQVSSIQSGLDKERLSMVRELRITTENDFDNELAALAVAVSPRIQSLILLAPDGYDWDSITYDMYASDTSLDIRMLEHSLERGKIGSRMLFPSLTHVHIDRFALQCIEFIPLLCRSAPNLETLYADFAVFRDITSTDLASPLAFPLRVESDTKLRSLAYHYGCFINSGEPEHGESEVVLSLLKHCPQLEELSISEVEEKSIQGDLLSSAIEDLCHLEDLHWSYSGFRSRGEDGVQSPDSAVPQMLSLKRLVMEYSGWASPTKYSIGLLPTAPHLRALCFNIAPRDTIYLSPMTSPRTIRPPFAAWVRNTPFLHTIHTCGIDHCITIDTPTVFPYLDHHQQVGNSTGSVRSYYFGGQELLHIRHQVQNVVISAVNYWRKEDEDKMLHVRVMFADGQVFPEGYVRVSDPEWEDWTDFEGVAVPMEVLEEMRVISGMDVGQWEKRGVEVDEAAWKVLLDWRKECVIEKGKA